MKTMIAWCGLEKEQKNKHLKHTMKKAIQMHDQLNRFSLSCKSQQIPSFVVNLRNCQMYGSHLECFNN